MREKKVSTPQGSDNRSRKQNRLNIGPILMRLEKERWREKPDYETARAIGIHPTTYSELKSGKAPPTLDHLRLLCRYFKVSLDTFDGDFVQRRGPLRWRVRSGLDERFRKIGIVAERTLEGHSPSEIAAGIADDKPGARKRLEAEITTMARAGLGLDLVELALDTEARHVDDVALADALARALSKAAPSSCPIAVKVVQNLAHADFERDPIVPFLIAREAHRFVAAFLEEHQLASTIGIAGGVHLGTFVRRIGPGSSPFPKSGTRRFDLVPLTLEPFHDHRFELADALVGEFYCRAAMLLGSRWVNAPSFMPFGFFEDHRISALETDSVLMVRELHHHLDVAIFGCGDQSDDGWIEWTQKLLGVKLDASTDVCLNMINATGEPIPLPKHAGQQRQYLGVGIDNIRRLASRPSKLALLLTSGKNKGLPITLVVRAGCANAVLCDQAAASAALDVLQPKGTAIG